MLPRGRTGAPVTVRRNSQSGVLGVLGGRGGTLDQTGISPERRYRTRTVGSGYLYGAPGRRLGTVASPLWPVYPNPLATRHRIIPDDSTSQAPTRDGLP